MAHRSEWDEEASPSPGRNPRNNPKLKKQKRERARLKHEQELEELTAQLSIFALGLLLITTYNQEREWPKDRHIERLLEHGLIEQNPTAVPACYRATARGAELIQFWAKRHTL